MCILNIHNLLLSNNWAEDLASINPGLNWGFILKSVTGTCKDGCVWLGGGWAEGGCCSPTSRPLLSHMLRVTKETTTGGWWVLRQQACQRNNKKLNRVAFTLWIFFLCGIFNAYRGFFFLELTLSLKYTNVLY